LREYPWHDWVLIHISVGASACNIEIHKVFKIGNLVVQPFLCDGYLIKWFCWIIVSYECEMRVVWRWRLKVEEFLEFGKELSELIISCCIETEKYWFIVFEIKLDGVLFQHKSFDCISFNTLCIPLI
jgi:hypothetical protein